MNRRTLDALSTYLAVWTVGLLVALGILAAADGIFGWDLLSPFLDKVAVLVLVSLAILLAATVLVSALVNLSTIASALSRLADRRDDREEP